MGKLIGLILTATFLLSACGGGGGGKDDENGGGNEVDVEIGQFIDSPVEGLRYVTDTQSGTTNAEGEYEYIDGETIRLYLGEWLIGETTATPEMTPFTLHGAKGLDDIVQFERWISSNIQSSYSSDVRAETRAINLAFLLQNLDLDSDPDNGITLPENLSDLTSGFELDLERLANQFKNHRAVRGVITRARVSGLWPNGLRVRSYGEVVKHLAETLYPTAQTSIKTRKTLANSTGGLDTPYSITDYFHDAGGRLIREDRDTDADGNTDTRNSYTRNALGLTSRTEVDTGADGSIDNHYTTTYTDYGLQTRDLRDNGNDGVEYDWRAEYNDFGRYTLIERYDNNALAVRNEYFYHPDGTYDYILRDTDGDGTMDERITYEHIDGLLMRTSYDTGIDGTANRVISYERNAAGDATLFEDDTDADGAANIINRYSYDEAGNTTRFEQDSDADGTPNYVQTITYNELGQTLETRTDTDGDGNTDQISRYVYNAEGFRTLYESDYDADPEIDNRITYSLDANGNAIRTEKDTNDDFVADQVEERSYNSFNQLTRFDRDDNADGVFNSRTEYSYETVLANTWFNRLSNLRFTF